MSVGWDGTYSRLGAGVQDGMFTWKIIAGIANSADSKILVGHVSILNRVSIRLVSVRASLL